MNGAAERLDTNARRRVGTFGRTVVRTNELVRHPVYTRIVHWGVAVFFVLALLSGFGIYSPWLRLADAAVRRRSDDAAPAPLVQHRLRRLVRVSVPELATADDVEP